MGWDGMELGWVGGRETDRRRLTTMQYILSQNRDLVGECQKLDGHTHRVTMRGDG